MTTADDSTHGSDAGYCFSSFTISGGVRLNPSGNGNVFIYVTGAVSVAGNADINNAQTLGTSDAKRFQIHSSYNTIGQATVGVSISGNATWYLFVNAPQTKITAGGNGTNMYGALIGYDFAITNGNFHLDKVFYNGGVISGPGNISYTWGAWTACKNPSCT